MATNNDSKKDNAERIKTCGSIQNMPVGNTENGQMPEDVIERKMFDLDAVRKETDGEINDCFDSSTEVEVREKESQPRDNATQHSNVNTLDRRSNIQTQQSKLKSDAGSQKDDASKSKQSGNAQRKR